MSDEERWASAHVRAAGPLQLVHDRPWSRVWKIPLSGDDAAWLKACAPVQAFEPTLTWSLHRRWPDRIVEVLACDPVRARLLLADAGTPVGAFGNWPDAWAVALPLYAELQRGEVEHVPEHLAAGVTDRRLHLLPALYEDMLTRHLPLEPDEIAALGRFAPRFAEMCSDLAVHGIPQTVQHDDLHAGNVYEKDGRVLILDWGDSSIAHPFFSLARADDEWDARLTAAYLEPWGHGLEEALQVALVIGSFAYAFGFLRVWDHMRAEERGPYADVLPRLLRRAYERVSADSSTRTRRGFEPS